MAIQALLAKIGVDTKAFDKGMKDSTKKVGGFSGALKKLGPLLGGLTVGKLVKDFVDLAARMQELSSMSGTSVESFQRMAFAAKQYGIEQDKVADILKDVSDKVGDFLTTGGGPLADFFETIAPKVGVTAEEFRNLSGKQALELYVSSLEKANLSQSEMTFFMEAIASDATALLPILSDNAAELNRLGDAAESMGLIMSEELIEQTRQAKNQLDTFMMLLTVLTGKIVSKVVPAFQLLGQTGELLGGAAVSLTLKFKTFFGFISSTAMAVIDPLITAFQGLFQMMMAGTKALTNPKEAIEQMKKATDTFKESFEDLKDAPSKVVDAYKKADDEMKTINKDMEAINREVTDRMGKSWDSLWGNVQKGAKKTAETVKTAGAAGEDGGTPPNNKPKDPPKDPPGEDTAEGIAKEEEKRQSDLTGEALRKAANIAGKDKNIRFDRMADGTFQQFINGRKGQRFTEDQMQVGLQNQIDNDDSKSLLEKINKTLEGKFVSQ
jgi:hypothetical protein